MKIKNFITASAVVALALLGFNASAGNVDANAASMAAKSFVSQHAAAQGKLMGPGSVGIKLAHAEASSVEGNAYYVFNVNGGGWVIIAGDDRANQVLAYGEQGSIDMNNLPENMKYYMDNYKAQIEAMQNYKGEVDPMRAPQRVQAVAPLLKSVNWAQQGPFNYQCPQYNNKYASVGCGGLAMAQVVNYWKYPEVLPAVGSYQNSYDYHYIPSLPARPIDWSLVRNQYAMWTEDGTLTFVDGVTEEEKQEVAWLCRYCAQACEMNFSPSGSGSNVMKQRNAFRTFGYTTELKLLGREAWPSRDTWNTTDYTHEEWVALMNEQLEAGRPIPYSMEDFGDGHAFVVDGIDADGLYHISWGWYGRGDGWFQYGAFNVTVQNEYMEFNDPVFMVVDLYPYEGYVIPGDDPTYELGDVNKDGDITIADVTKLISLVLKNISEGYLEVGDMDGDGSLTISDVTRLITLALNRAN